MWASYSGGTSNTFCYCSNRKKEFKHYDYYDSGSNLIFVLVNRRLE